MDFLFWCERKTQKYEKWDHDNIQYEIFKRGLACKGLTLTEMIGKLRESDQSYGVANFDYGYLMLFEIPLDIFVKCFSLLTLQTLNQLASKSKRFDHRFTSNEEFWKRHYLVFDRCPTDVYRFYRRDCMRTTDINYVRIIHKYSHRSPHVA